jgi:hypothetical protein
LLGDQTEIRVDDPGRSEILMVISTGVDSRDFLRIPGVDDWAMIKVLFVQWSDFRAAYDCIFSHKASLANILKSFAS